MISTIPSRLPRRPVAIRLRLIESRMADQRDMVRMLRRMDETTATARTPRPKRKANRRVA